MKSRLSIIFMLVILYSLDFFVLANIILLTLIFDCIITRLK